MSNNNEAPGANENNNEEIDQNNHNAPEWGAFPDLLRVQEPNGAGLPAPQRAGVANPPDVSLPGAAGRDPPPPDFDIDPASRNQRLPDMALDASQARPQPARCGGAQARPRMQVADPNPLVRMAQAAVVDNGVENRDQVNREDAMERAFADRIFRQLDEMREELAAISSDMRAISNRLQGIEASFERPDGEFNRASREFAEAMRMAMTYFIRRLDPDQQNPDDGG